jgi:hypothetical protein
MHDYSSKIINKILKSNGNIPLSFISEIEYNVQVYPVDENRFACAITDISKNKIENVSYTFVFGVRK